MESVLTEYMPHGHCFAWAAAAVVSLWAAARVARARLGTCAQDVEGAVAVVGDALQGGALDSTALADLDVLARAHDDTINRVARSYATLDLVGANIPDSAVLLGVANADGEPVVEYAGGEVIRRGGYDESVLLGMRVRGIAGERHTQVLSGAYTAEFVPVTHPDGRAMVLVYATDLKAP